MRSFMAVLTAQFLVYGLLPAPAKAQSAPSTNPITPIKHIVVIFQENVSFDHYFGTYPNALNPAGSPSFTPLPNTPR